MARPRTPTLERFRKYATCGTADECWPWQGYCDKDGYGMLRSFVGDKYLFRRVHRMVYESVRGPIPRGVLVLHTCDNPSCSNPAHLRLGTAQDNSNDMVAKGRNKCGVRGDSHHKAKTRTIALNGQSHSLAGWSAISGIPRKVIRDRLEREWPIDKAISVPVRKSHKIKHCEYTVR